MDALSFFHVFFSIDNILLLFSLLLLLSFGRLLFVLCYPRTAEPNNKPEFLVQAALLTYDKTDRIYPEYVIGCKVSNME